MRMTAMPGQRAKLLAGFVLAGLSLLAGCASTTAVEPAAAAGPTDLLTPERVEALWSNGFSGMFARSGALLIAGTPAAEGLARLPELGVRSVIDLRTARELDDAELDEQQQLDRLGIAWVSLPAGGEDAPYSPTHVTELDRLLSAADGPVLLHCGSGYRATHLYVAWLHRARGLPLADALAIGERLREGALPLEGFLAQPLSEMVGGH